eukprot:CAMPEP_0114514104 /NCGR_PEP_ID=MMETSP0109-20121206/15960_1 /TAXON_ID=29199 /ORGANISM="Chlorarachnion reptans, Strain CCCM449" /LENGTH=668 /DNA_ID=CAMNT_0001694091 /DNA_START=118 /DNA_END=2121 /DNA_ORIENTATION=+
MNVIGALLVLAGLVVVEGNCNGNGDFNSTTELCSCDSGWSGSSCETPICEKECVNDGYCIGANKCQCPVGFDGETCEEINAFGSPSIKLVLGYAIVCIASWVMGNVAPKIGLPRITAYIGMGVLAGGYCLGIIPEEEIRNLDVVDKVSLGYIAFAAGSKPIVGGRSIMTVTLCLVLFTFSLVTLTFVLISPNLDFTKELNAGQQGGVAILVGTLACARSPSSAIAIIDDLRAAGKFTVLTMAVTCVMDVLVIFMFAVMDLIASSQFDNGHDSTTIFGKSIARLILSSLFGAFMGKLIIPYALWWWPPRIKQCRYTSHIHYAQVCILLAIGLLVFILDHYDDDLLDALIIAMVAGYVIANHTPYSKQFHELLDKTSTVMYVLFFTLVGASLGLDSFGNTFGISMLFFVIRILSLMMGSFIGGWLADEPNEHNKRAWMAYVTQAGVALGLAKKVHGEYPEWGADFATLIVAMVVLNQIVGPPLFKHVLWTLGDAGKQPPRVRGKVVVIGAGETPEVRSAMMALGKIGWQCKFVNAKGKIEGGEDDEKKSSNDISLEVLCNKLNTKLTDQVKVCVVFLPAAIAKQVAVYVLRDFPECRVILQQLNTPETELGDEGRPRAQSYSEVVGRLPPDVITLNPPETSADQLMLAAALSNKSLFPSIRSALQEAKDW